MFPPSLLRALQLTAPAILLSSWSQSWGAAATNITTPVAAPYYSRPDIVSIFLNVTQFDEDLVSPGYIFLAPYQIDQPGPYIFDNYGNLIWTGANYVGPMQVHNFQVCTYQGSDHLCMFQGNQELGYGAGHDVILDNTFTTVKSIEAGNDQPSIDLHEFNLVDDNANALVSGYKPVQYDLSSVNITNAQGFVLESMFQEIAIDSGDVLFEWASLNFVNLSASYVLPGTTDVSGNGTFTQPWDYFHINSVDKNDEGDYLVSSRHTSTIFKIDGNNGSIIWRLGGKYSDFSQNFNFSYQHDARFVSANQTTTVISFYDNAANGFNGSYKYSEGKVVAIDNSTGQATLLQAYNSNVSSASQGNVQMLPNGNVFVGHGSVESVSEFLENGTQIYYAQFATTGSLQYRSYKFNFTSNPRTTPALYAYAQNTSAPVTAYVSWNGATEVALWRLYAGSSASDLAHVGNFLWSGFETVSTYPSFAAYVVAEAVAANGTALKNSSVTGTFVPSSGLAASCNEIQCPLAGDGAELSPQIVAFGMGNSTPTAGPHPTGVPGLGIYGQTPMPTPSTTSSSALAVPTAVAAAGLTGILAAAAGAGALLL